jgi:hypothetical protein
MKELVLGALVLLGSGLLTACTEADRDAMFSTDKPPLVGKCDPQPGYPPPSQRPGCENVQGGGRQHR